MAPELTVLKDRVIIRLAGGIVLVLTLGDYRDALRRGKGFRRALELEQRLAASTAQEEDNQCSE